MHAIGTRTGHDDAIGTAGGSPSRPDAPAVTSTPPEERKSATILFADIVDSTSLVAENEPEAALGLQRAALPILADAAQRYGGTVNQVAGDGLMVMFGAPAMDEEHALGACCAALEMHAALARSTLGIKVRVGIHTGEVVVHVMRLHGLEALGAAGEAVHLAARLQQGASPGGTWISEATFGLARGRVVTRAMGQQSLRGFRTPVSVHLLQAADASLTRFDVAGRRGLSTFVDRLDEMPALEAAHARAVAGEGGAVALVGEAGVGKSRLIREFAAAHGGARVLEACCTRWRDDTGFHPFRVLTRRLLGLDATEDPAAARKRLEAAFAGPDAPPAEALAGMMALHGVGMDAAWARLDPRQRRRLIVEGCRAVLRHAASEEPLVVVLDDLHWADPGTEEVVGHLLDGLAGTRLLLILSRRPEYRPSWAGRPEVAQVTLSPLEPAYATDLARSVLADRGADDAAVGGIVARASGNPFFIEEAAAMPDTAQIPPTIRSLLSARLDRLAPEQKRLVEAVAAVAEPAPYDLLALVLGAETPSGGIEAAGAELERAGLLRVEGIGAATRLACRHPLLQEVAYAGLTLARRVTLHARIATVLETLAGERAEDEAEVLARHARLGGLWEPALRYARMAGARAASRSSNREAARFYEEALEALARMPENADTLTLGVDLRFALRDPLYRLGRIGLLRTRLDEAAALAGRLENVERLGQLYVFQSHHAWLAGDYAAAVAAAGRASDLAADKGDAALHLRAVFQRSLGDLGRGDAAATATGMDEVARRAEDPALAGRFGLDAPLVVVALSYRARALTDLGAFDEAEVAARACEARAAEVARPFSSIFAAVAGGYLRLARGEMDEALAQLDAAAALCWRAEADLMRPVALGFLGAAQLGLGQVEAALATLQAAVEGAEAMGFMFQQPMRLALLSDALRAAGRLDEAARRAGQATALAVRQGAAPHAAVLLAPRAFGVPFLPR